jgi:hypothetical protein
MRLSLSALFWSFSIFSTAAGIGGDRIFRNSKLDMKTKAEKKKMSVDSDLVIPFTESDENQEFDISEYEEDNFYSFLTEDHFNLVDDIRKWESFRYMI